MKRWLAHPLFAASLFVVWVLLQVHITAASLIAGAILALVLARIFDQLEPPPLRLRGLRRLPILLWRVFADIVRSNFAVVAIIVLRRPHTSGFLTIPLTMTHPWGLAALAGIITATPGTLWANYNAETQELVIHVLDLVDRPALVARIQQRYESPLRELFQ